MTSAEFRDASHLGRIRAARMSLKEVLDDEEDSIIPGDDIRAVMVILKKWESTLDGRITIRDYRKAPKNGAAEQGVLG